jgi:hypothetical protein
MPNLRQDGSANRFHRPDDDVAGAWLTAAVAIVIMVGVIFCIPGRSYEPVVTQHATIVRGDLP